MKIFFLSILFTLTVAISSAQSPKAIILEKQITSFNDQAKFTKSIQTIDLFLKNNTNSNYDLYYAYLLKSYTYKRLFDYENVVKYLDIALQEGIQSDKKEEVEAVINAEKSFVYFDLQHYDKAIALMNKCKANDFAFLDSKTKSFLIMQEGFISYLNKDYTNSEKEYDKAIVLMKKYHPRDLPIVYGKKVLLYSKINKQQELKESFENGIFYAKKYHILKYQIYLYEVYRNQFEEKSDFKNAFLNFKKFDSLSTVYNTEQNKSKIKIFEKDLVLNEKEFELKRNKLWIIFITIILIILIVLVIIAIQLYRLKKSKHQLLEKDYTRIHDELLLLSQKMNKKNDFEKYNLKERQLEVIDLLRKGKSNKQIAEQLFISENTVKYHLKAIYDILDIDNRKQLFKILDNN